MMCARSETETRIKRRGGKSGSLLPQPLSSSRRFPRIPGSLPFSEGPAKQLPLTLLSAQVLTQKSHHFQQPLLQQQTHMYFSLSFTHTHILSHTQLQTLTQKRKKKGRTNHCAFILAAQMHICLVCFLSSNVAVDWL